MQARELKIKTEREHVQMEKKWELLNASEKAHYKGKLTKFREKL